MSSHAPLRPYHSTPYLATTHHPHHLTTATSEPTLSPRKSHPLLDDLDDPNPHTYAELLLAAETLESIVAEGVLVGATVRRFKGGTKGGEGGGMSDRVLKLVYGTMKCKHFLYFYLAGHW